MTFRVICTQDDQTIKEGEFTYMYVRISLLKNKGD